MNLAEPMSDVMPGALGHLIAALARLERPTSIRRLAALANVSPGHASAMIRELVESGIVDSEKIGRSLAVSLNRDHLAVGPLLEIAAMRRVLIERVRSELETWGDLRAAWLFGSVARGDATRESDVDLCFVVTDRTSESLHTRLTNLSASIQRWTGNELQAVEYEPASWQLLVEERNPLVDAIRREGIPLVDGSELLLARKQ
jgi:predicted nucleotidyltransferase